MRIISIVILFATVLVIASCNSAPSPPAPPVGDSPAVAILVMQRLDAARNGDTAAWHRQVSDSCIFTGPSLQTASTRAVLNAIAANKAIKVPPQRILNMTVYPLGQIVLVSYVQLVGDTSRPEREGKRFRKTDTYVRSGDSWRMISATEIAVPYRASIALPKALASQIAGDYVLPEVDTLTIRQINSRAFLQIGRDGTTDTLLVEDDSTFYVEGDPGSWVFRYGANSPASTMIYRMQGAPDIILTRIQ